MTGRTILEASRLDAPPGPKYANLERAAGQEILAVHRRGKFLVAPLSAGDELVIHLGMTGTITPEEPASHARARVKLSAGANPDLYFRDVRRFGRFLVTKACDYQLVPSLGTLGPEPLSSQFTASAFHQALKQSRVPLKTYLLSQRPVAGLGNIYADEALYHARISPLIEAHRISKRRAARLRDAIREVLAGALEAQGTTLSDYRTVAGQLGSFSTWLNVYGREGTPCPRCRTIIAKVTLAARSTHYCPRCQRR